MFCAVSIINDQMGGMDFDTEFNLLCSHAKLDRDKGYLTLKGKLEKEVDLDKSIVFLKEKILVYINDKKENISWEPLHGHLQIGKIMLELKISPMDLSENLLSKSLEFLEHEEFRIRVLSGEILGVLCRNIDSSFYRKCEPVLMSSIRQNLKRDVVENVQEMKDVFHDTAGWKCLETSMKGLQCVIDGCGTEFFAYLNKTLLDLIFESLDHTNRFVRETAFYVCSAIALHGISSKENCEKTIAKSLSHYLAKGLADNWSQVRMAASVATRQFFQNLDNTDREGYLAELLPPMCLNRYYLAEGVKLYNQESWKIIFGQEGQSKVEKYINEVVAFYISQTECDNHAVREAACHCMAELGSKISRDIVRPFVSKILGALHVCFQDDSWPVRDTACIACGNFILAFPNECEHSISSLYPLFFANLKDPIPSVRQGAAIALFNVVQAYKEDTLEIVLSQLNEGFKSIASQKEDSQRYEGLEKGAANYGVVKKLHDNDLDLHTNQVMFSCGSLAPKLKRGGGCMDHSFKRSSEPWEFADGCVYLLSEIVSCIKSEESMKEAMTNLTNATKYKHYKHHMNFFATVNKALPKIARGLGKQTFKKHLEKFFDAIFYSLSCENALTRASASECLYILCEYLGPNILRGRIDQYNSSYLQAFEKTCF